MMKKGIKLLCGATVTKVDENSIYYTQDGQDKCICDADTLVFAAGYKPDPALEEMLKAAGSTYHLIGDAEKVGTIKDAVTSAWQVAKDL